MVWVPEIATPNQLRILSVFLFFLFFYELLLKKENQLLDTNVLKRYIELTNQKKNLNAELKEVNFEMDRLKDRIIDHMIENETDRVTINGKNISYKSQIWMKKETFDDSLIKDKLRQLDMEEYISLNSQRLSSWIRERIQSGEGLPKELDGILSYQEKTTVSVTSAGG